MRGFLACIVLVGTSVELLEPHVAAHMEITDPVAGILLLGDPLLNDATLEDNRLLDSVSSAVFKLGNAEKGGVGHLEPCLRLHDTNVIRTGTAGGLLCHAEAYQVQEIIPHRMECCSAVKTQHERIVRLIVAIQVNRGNGIGFGVTCFWGSSMVIIAHKHHGIIINGMIIRIHPHEKRRRISITCDGFAHGGVN